MEDLSSSDSSSLDEGIFGERQEPIGAANDYEEEICKYSSDSEGKSSEKVKILEEEQELLNSALFALTTHFAQVQFRLRQILNTPSQDKEKLLSSLEKFAQQGLPDIKIFRDKSDDSGLQEAVRTCRIHQREQIRKLKWILNDLEYHIDLLEGGEAMNEEIIKIKSKFNEQYCKYMSTHVECNLKGEQNKLFVEQLKMQVEDLENFIKFIKYKCICKEFNHSIGSNSKGTFFKLVQEFFLLLQFLAAFQIRCSSYVFVPSHKQNKIKTNHWGELRAKLELAIHYVLDIVKRKSDNGKSQTLQNYVTKMLHNKKLMIAVRKDLAICLRNLMEHGIKTPSNVHIIPLNMCFRSTNSSDDQKRHAWDIILRYYQLESGSLVSSISKSLSQSFNLNINGTLSLNNKQTMLSTIENITNTHTKYKRSYDSQFKAFVCAGLNCNKLGIWLEMLYDCDQIKHQHYHTWSYAAKTRFQDTSKSLEVLTKYKFELPVDLAILNFENMDDAFT